LNEFRLKDIAEGDPVEELEEGVQGCPHLMGRKVTFIIK